MKYAVWQNNAEGEPKYHTLKIENVEDLVTAHVPPDATMIDADSHGEALDLFIERRTAAVKEG